MIITLGVVCIPLRLETARITRNNGQIDFDRRTPKLYNPCKERGHLDSTVAVTDASGPLTSQQRYLPPVFKSYLRSECFDKTIKDCAKNYWDGINCMPSTSNLNSDNETENNGNFMKTLLFY